jgi:exodeoxyribonuclease VII large subunit
LRILARGYTVTENADGQLIKSSAQLKTGEILVTRFKDGQVVSQVKEISQGKGEEE